MKKIINGKCYNTQTAELKGEYEYSTSNDFNYVREALYQTKKGQWFIEYEGGPLSQYRKALGNNQTGGDSGIILYTEEEAKAWGEQHLEADTYEKLFEVEEG